QADRQLHQPPRRPPARSLLEGGGVEGPASTRRPEGREPDIRVVGIARNACVYSGRPTVAEDCKKILLARPPPICNRSSQSAAVSFIAKASRTRTCAARKRACSKWRFTPALGRVRGERGDPPNVGDGDRQQTWAHPDGRPVGDIA